MAACRMAAPYGFQSTLPTRGSDFAHANIDRSIVGISIHAPHEGERLYRLIRRCIGTNISIHAPHEGERPDFLACIQDTT